MNDHTIILIGVGEMGGVFARGFLRTGHTVIPINRNQTADDIAEIMPAPKAVLISVGEKDLQSVISELPEVWNDKAILLQNELLPRDWKNTALINPTVISVWFEKKKGQDAKVIVPSPTFGSRAELLRDALGSLDIPVKVLASEQQLIDELVLKNLYIITTNIAGLKVHGNVGELWEQHEALARDVANDVLDIQEWLTGQSFDRESLIQAMVVCFNGDMNHQCMGRSAPARLARALAQADEAGLSVMSLRAIDKLVNN